MTLQRPMRASVVTEGLCRDSLESTEPIWADGRELQARTGRAQCLWGCQAHCHSVVDTASRHSLTLVRKKARTPSLLIAKGLNAPFTAHSMPPSVTPGQHRQGLGPAQLPRRHRRPLPSGVPSISGEGNHHRLPTVRPHSVFILAATFSFPKKVTYNADYLTILRNEKEGPARGLIPGQV